MSEYIDGLKDSIRERCRERDRLAKALETASKREVELGEALAHLLGMIWHGEEINTEEYDRAYAVLKRKAAA